jgi:beta-lactamase class A
MRRLAAARRASGASGGRGPSGRGRGTVPACGKTLACALAVVVLAAPASAEELERPRAYEAFFGVVTARAPAGATRAQLFAGGRLVVAGPVAAGVARFRPSLPPGRYDVRIRFRAAGGRIVGRAESRNVWLLPASARTARRERSRDARLSHELARLGGSFHAYAGLWVHDLATGRTAGWNADASFPAASTVKLGVLVAALDRFGTSRTSPAWRDIRDLATWSSNIASNTLLLRLGGSEAAGARIVQDTLHRLGATESTFTGNYQLGTVATRDEPRPLPILTYRRTTAHDLGRILLELHGAAIGNGLSLRRTRLTQHEARVALGLLLSTDSRGDNLGLLRPALPAGTPMAQKQGWTTKIRHTAAVVYRPSGPVIVIVLTYGPNLRPGDARLLGIRVVDHTFRG